MKRTCEIGSAWPEKPIKNWYVCRCWRRNKTNESRSINRRVRFKWRVVVVSGVLGRKTTSQIGSISHVNACALYTVAIRYIGETFDRLHSHTYVVRFFHRRIIVISPLHFFPLHHRDRNACNLSTIRSMREMKWNFELLISRSFIFFLFLIIINHNFSKIATRYSFIFSDN